MDTKEMAMSIAKAMAAPMQSAMEEICNKVYAQLESEHKADIEKRNKFFTEQYNALEEERARLDDELVKCKADYGKKLAEALADVDALKKALEAKGSEPMPMPKTDPQPKKKFGAGTIYHKMFDKILSLVKGHKAVYMNGDAGAGKNVIAEQVADKLGVPFYMSAKLGDEYGIKGFVDANGNFVETAFFKAFTQGGLFLLDEMDASAPDALTALNSALANGYFDFPKLGLVYAHPDFYVMANGNTAGTGADERYTSRNCLDAATLDRFRFMQIEYDERIELACAENDKALVEFVHDVRNAVKNMGNNCLMISYRGISNYVSDYHLGVFSDTEIMKMDITKGLDNDNILMIYENLSNKKNRYARVLNSLAYFGGEEDIAA